MLIKDLKMSLLTPSSIAFGLRPPSPLTSPHLTTKALVHPIQSGRLYSRQLNLTYSLFTF